MRRLLLLTALLAVAAPAVAQAEPLIARTCNGSSDCSGWFRGPVRLEWSVAGGSPVSGCADVTLTQDTTGAQQGCIASDGVDTIDRTVTIKLDRTAPLVTEAVPDRVPDHGGWYSRPVTFTARGTDATSGVLGCDEPTYAGPDAISATVVATCRDIAGNAASRMFPLRYDATAPDLGPALISAADKVVRVNWPAAESATLVRTPGPAGSPSGVVYEGPGGGFIDREVRNGRRYRYVLTLIDDAGNAGSRDLVAVPGPHLLGPPRRATVTAPPLLRWTPVRGARYYNVQLFRGGRKVLSAWPREAPTAAQAALAVPRPRPAARRRPLPLVRVARRGTARGEPLRRPRRRALVRDGHALRVDPPRRSGPDAIAAPGPAAMPLPPSSRSRTGTRAGSRRRPARTWRT